MTIQVDHSSRPSIFSLAITSTEGAFRSRCWPWYLLWRLSSKTRCTCWGAITSVGSSLLSSTLGTNVSLMRSLGLEKYDQEVYDAVMDLFDNLPLSAIINSKFLCLHGGISTDVQSVILASSRSLLSKRSRGPRKYRNLAFFAIWCGLIRWIMKLAS